MNTNSLIRNLMHEQLSLSGENPIKARFFKYEQFTFPSHIHDAYEIIYIKEGTGKRFIGDSIENYSKNEIFLTGPNLPHHLTNDSPYVKGTIIQFEKSFMDYAITYYPQFTHIRRLLSESKCGVCFPQAAGNSELIRIIEEIPGSAGLSQIINILYLLDKMGTHKQKERIAASYFQDASTIITDNRIKKVLSYINYNYTQPIQLADIASVAAMNPAAFCRYFKEKTGKTYLQFIMELRIGYACRLLKNDHTEISRIAEKCGFMTMTHFGNMFKRHTGMTPTCYRQQAG